MNWFLSAHYLRVLCAVLLLCLSIRLDGALIGHWDLDETSGNALDSSGNCYHGTLCTAWGSITQGSTGKIGNAYSGAAGKIDLGNTAALKFSNTSTYTMAGWVKCMTNLTGIFGQEKTSGSYQGASLLATPWYVEGRQINNFGSGNYNQYRYTNCLTGCTNWHHFVFTYTGNCDVSGICLYSNGACVGAGIYNGLTATTVDSGNVYIGARFGVRALIDDVAVWDEALTGDEVKSLYDVGDNACLGYDAGDFNTLKGVHDCGSGSVTICGTTWSYATGLCCSAGLTICGASKTLVLDATANTGLIAVTNLYWDDNGSTAGATCGTTAPDTWSAAATKWSASCAGTGCSSSWASGANAYFSAGTDATGTYTITVCGTQTVGSLNFQEGTVTLSGGTITMGDSTPCIDVAACRTATISSTVAGSNGITKTGAGTLNLTGTLSVTGNRNINGGALNRTGTWVIENCETTTIRCGADLSVSADIYIGDCSTGTMTVTGSGSTVTALDRIRVGFSGGTGTLNIQCGATVHQDTAGEYVMVGCASTGTITMTGNCTTLTVDGRMDIGRGCSGDGTVTVQCGADINLTCACNFLLIGGTHASAVGRLTVTGCGSTVSAGRVRVGHSSAGANTLTISNCGTLTSTNGMSVGTSACAVGTVNINSGGDLNATTLAIASGCGSTGTVTVCGVGSKLCASTSVTVGRSAGGATANLNMNAGSCLTTPILTINNGGTVTLNAADRISDTTDLTVNASGTFDLNNNNETIASLAGAGSVTLGSGTLTVGDCSSTTFSGVISETGSVTKVGTGTLTLSGTNTNTGTYTITAGTLTIGASNVIDDSADINLNGGTLAISSNFSDTADNFTVTENSILALNTDTDLTFGDFALTATKTFNITGFAKTTKYQTNQTGISLRFAEAGGWPSYDANNFFVNGTALSAGVYGFAHGGDGFIYLILLAPEPSTYVGIGGVCLFAGLHFVRRRSRKKEKESSIV